MEPSVVSDNVEKTQRNGGEAKNIEVFVRVRPSSDKKTPYLFTDPDEIPHQKLSFRLPKDLSRDVVNNSKEEYDFRFDRVFEQPTTQEEVFDAVAKNVVLRGIEGYNGTIFAYGQTGSGKTFTITGGAERYVDRGIIPRALSLLYSEFQRRSDYQFSAHISYLEIYNEHGYDLLDPNHETKSLEDLPKVSMQADEDGNIHMKNLSAHLANNEEEALNLLFLGDTNRMICETPMNPNSSRSHCVFTLFIEARKTGSDSVRRSKIHLVDLAGSERVGKTNASGQLLREAQSINLSLHYLEQVIKALQARSKGQNSFVPYRNSILTSILRDSLGGNCATTLVATIAPERAHTFESISTCRFAQRCAEVKNVVELNEEVDPKLVIKRLKGEIRELKEEIAVLKGGDDVEDNELTPEEMRRVEQLVGDYIKDDAPDASFAPGNMARIRYSYTVFKRYAKGKEVDSGKGGPKKEDVEKLLKESEDTVAKLKLELQRRDNEITILVNMLKKKGGGELSKSTNQDSLVQSRIEGSDGSLAKLSSTVPFGQPSSSAKEQSRNGISRNDTADSMNVKEGNWTSTQSAPVNEDTQQIDAPLVAKNLAPGAEKLLTEPDKLMDRDQAFAAFRKSYRKNEAIEENKSVLKSKCDEAKYVAQVATIAVLTAAVFQQVNEARSKVQELKALIEQLRVERALTGMLDKGGDQPQEADPEEERTKALIDKEKARYKTNFDKLRDLKKEIDHLKMMVEMSRERLQKDFEQWYSSMLKQKAMMLKSENQDKKRQDAPARREAADLSKTAPALERRDTDSHASVPLTGDKEADAEILAFYKARETLMQKK